MKLRLLPTYTARKQAGLLAQTGDKNRVNALFGLSALPAITLIGVIMISNNAIAGEKVDRRCDSTCIKNSQDPAIGSLVMGGSSNIAAPPAGSSPTPVPSLEPSPTGGGSADVAVEGPMAFPVAQQVVATCPAGKYIKKVNVGPKQTALIIGVGDAEIVAKSLGGTTNYVDISLICTQTPLIPPFGGLSMFNDPDIIISVTGNAILHPNAGNTVVSGMPLSNNLIVDTSTNNTKLHVFNRIQGTTSGGMYYQLDTWHDPQSYGIPFNNGFSSYMTNTGYILDKFIEMRNDVAFMPGYGRFNTVSRYKYLIIQGKSL